MKTAPKCVLCVSPLPFRSSSFVSLLGSSSSLFAFLFMACIHRASFCAVFLGFALLSLFGQVVVFFPLSLSLSLSPCCLADLVLALARSLSLSRSPPTAHALSDLETHLFETRKTVFTVGKRRVFPFP